ncbi:hypothetical protein NA57DRAFT_38621 [Rhizodiscina lignyota]|uniref:ARID domain-containing protein n=1 Tax=Rhizodiscina lignyota TaxID=1504668 RepID=A0A9P4IFM5_9PEZI|nr:hypothetical protein NA57DRAFT_38621 [Rhizodiscina lignyota]
MQNGAFQNPQYSVNPVVPSKRPRPNDDNISASPRPNPNLNLSRSQTPHQPGGFPGFPNSQPQPPNPYQHLQQGGSANATPSPTLQDQQFRPPTTAQRMNASPSPFPGAQPGMGMSMSPPPDANGSRVNTPLNPSFPMGGMNMPPSSTPQAYNPNYGGTPGMTPGQMQGGGMPQGVVLSQNLAQRQQEATRIHHMRLQQQQQSLAAQNAAAQNRHQMGMMGGMGGMSGQNPAMNTPTRNPQAMNAQLAQFMRNLQSFMQSNGRQIEIAPMICGRQVHLYQLYMLVMRSKGSQVVNSKSGWPNIAQALGFPPTLIQQAAQELKIAYERNLAPYESAYWRSRQDATKQVNPQMQGAQAGMNQQMSPTRPMPGNQLGQMTPVQNNATLPATNGWSTPQSDMANSQRQSSMGAPNKMVKTEASPAVQQPGIAAPSPATTDKFPEGQPMEQPSADAAPGNTPQPEKVDHGTHYIPQQFHLMDHHGGITVNQLNTIGLQIDMIKPVVPDTEEMGMVDIRALCMSLQSGISGEVRYALDHLIKLSHETRIHFLDLERCEDLIDVLIECAEDQVDVLREEAAEVSDIIDLTPYEDVIRHCRAEVESLQDIPDFATAEYDLDRASDRLIAVTTILRNLSFWPQNHPQLASEHTIKFFSTTIRLIGTRHLLLRNHTNTQDFMKDFIVFLSNVTDKIELPSREDALNILNFLISFAPQPSPTSSSLCRFARYNPSIHRYLPPAVDSLAKLLARDDPNRAYYRHLFLNDPCTLDPKLPPHQQYDLLSRAFALAISVIPDRTASRSLTSGGAEYRISEARKPYLIQGMLAADILATLVPSSDSGLARAWLEAEDGWAPSLLRLACTLSTDRTAPTGPGGPGRRPGQQGIPDHELGFGLVTHRAFGMLQKLGEKTKNDLLTTGAVNGLQPQKDRQMNGELEKEGEEGDSKDEDAINAADTGANGDESDDESERQRKQLLKVMADVLPQREVLLGALLTPNIEAQALKQLCAFAALEV